MTKIYEMTFGALFAVAVVWGAYGAVVEPALDNLEQSLASVSITN